MKPSRNEVMRYLASLVVSAVAYVAYAGVVGPFWPFRDADPVRVAVAVGGAVVITPVVALGIFAVVRRLRSGASSGTPPPPLSENLFYGRAFLAILILAVLVVGIAVVAGDVGGAVRRAVGAVIVVVGAVVFSVAVGILLRLLRLR